MLSKAIELAKTLNQEHRHACIISDKKGRVLSYGFNSYKKSHPRQAYYAEKVGNRKKIFLHSEISAIINLPYNSSPHTIYVARVNKHGEPLNSEPCDICRMAISDIGIKKVIYT